MSEISKIIEFVRTNSLTPRISLARMSLMVGMDVNNVKDQEHYSPVVMESFKKAALEITGKVYR